MSQFKDEIRVRKLLKNNIFPPYFRSTSVALSAIIKLFERFYIRGKRISDILSEMSSSLVSYEEENLHNNLNSSSIATIKRLKPSSFDDTSFQLQNIHHHHHHHHFSAQSLQLQSIPEDELHSSQNSIKSETPRSVKLKRSHSFSDLQHSRHPTGINNDPSPPETSEMESEGRLTDVEMMLEEDGNEVENEDSLFLVKNAIEAENLILFDRSNNDLPTSPRSTVSTAEPFYGKFLRGVQKSLRVIFRCVTKKNISPSPTQIKKTIHGSDSTLVDKRDSSPDILLTQISSADEEVVIKQKISQITQLSKNQSDETAVNTFVIDVPLSSVHVQFNFTNHLYKNTQPLLPSLEIEDVGKKCLVLDLDETLVHSSFQPTPLCDLLLPIGIADGYLFVCKRPGVDVFLEKVCRLFEVVIFTASLSTYANPVIDFLDPNGLIKHRLFRESCVQLHGLYIKDLSRLGRSLDQVLIIDNSPASYLLQPDSALAIKSWFNDTEDMELHRLLPMLNRLSVSEGVSAWKKSELGYHGSFI